MPRPIDPSRRLSCTDQRLVLSWPDGGASFSSSSSSSVNAFLRLGAMSLSSSLAVSAGRFALATQELMLDDICARASSLAALSILAVFLAALVAPLTAFGGVNVTSTKYTAL